MASTPLRRGQTCTRWRNLDCGNAATNRLNKLINGVLLDCTALDRDVYCRVVATCRSDTSRTSTNKWSLMGSLGRSSATAKPMSRRSKRRATPTSGYGSCSMARDMTMNQPAAALPLDLPPMEAASVDELPSGGGWQYEPKYDGFRCLAHRQGSRVHLQSKNQKPLERYFPEVSGGLAALAETSFVLDGELVITRRLVRSPATAAASGREPHPQALSGNAGADRRFRPVGARRHVPARTATGGATPDARVVHW